MDTPAQPEKRKPGRKPKQVAAPGRWRLAGGLANDLDRLNMIERELPVLEAKLREITIERDKLAAEGTLLHKKLEHVLEAIPSTEGENHA